MSPPTPPPTPPPTQATPAEINKFAFKDTRSYFRNMFAIFPDQMAKVMKYAPRTQDETTNLMKDIVNKF